MGPPRQRLDAEDTLGLQVHDVSGFSVDATGTRKATPPGHPYLRLTRTLEPGFVVTIEPGLYRAGYGGLRLEDIVLVTDDGYEVLTDYPYDLKP
mgnify:CR=1 FL=1